jgi:hypothetical protein
VTLLEKPFGKSELLTAVRDRIDAEIDACAAGEGVPHRRVIS